MYIFKKRVFFSVLMLLLGVAMVSTPAIAQENTEESEPKLSGKIMDSSTQQALTGIEVNILGMEKTATTDKKGKFSFDSLEAGSYTIIVKIDGYENWRKEVKLPEHGKEMSIELKPTEVG